MKVLASNTTNNTMTLQYDEVNLNQIKEVKFSYGYDDQPSILAFSQKPAQVSNAIELEYNSEEYSFTIRQNDSFSSNNNTFLGLK